MTNAITRVWRGCLLLAACIGAAAAAAQGAPAPLPSFAELEAAGARVGEVRISAREIFDTADPKEDKWLFRGANALHIQTRPGVIESALLFKTGDAVSVNLIEETERVLRTNRYLYDVQIRPLAVHDGVVDIEVETRDTWSLDPGFSAGRSGGANSSGLQLREYNLLGTGLAMAIGHSNTVDRKSNEMSISKDRAFGGWTSLNYSIARNSDGRRDAGRIEQPFYALDAPWAAGLSLSDESRIDPVYNAGELASQYRHVQKRGDLYGGWSAGRVDGWVHRWSVGLGIADDVYTVEPGLAAPAVLPSNEKLVSPYLRYELIEDRFEKLQNRNLVGRTEFFTLGLNAKLQLGWASTALGSSRQALLYSGTLGRGFEPAPEHTLITTATLDGQYADGQVRRQRFGAAAQYYLPQSPHWLFYAAASGDVLQNPDAADTLLLGGDNGLRGYPLRYQSGNRRMLFTVEERAYSNVYPFRLFRIGGAVFVDAGRAWGGDNVNAVAPGWLGNAGIGLRIVSVRAAFSNVLHIDLAFPINAPPDVNKVQFLVKTKTSF